MRLRPVIFKTYKLNKIVPKEFMCTVYNALYKSIFQYGLIVWEGYADNAMRFFIIQQNRAVRISPHKNVLTESSVSNYK